MSVVYELFGYVLGDNSKKAKLSRRRAMCPFMGKQCDGGGNRKMARVFLKNDASLRSYFDGVGSEVECGICSIEQNKQKWVICPRRIMCFGESAWQADALTRTLLISGWKPPQRLAIWREAAVNVTEENQKFQYTFDYIVRRLDENDMPYGEPLVVEIMTCSTSGGNRSKGTDIQAAFCKAVRGEEHRSPGINHRQVWARMASQLIVKSQAGLQWGGRTVWVIQDVFADYIAHSTGLRLSEMRSNEPNEVNLLAFRYSEEESSPDVLRTADLYAGPISSGGDGKPCFMDIVRPAFVPNFGHLEQSLERRDFQILEWNL